MCIYLKNDNNLTYNKQEHIFSAAIGGIRKLDLGIVSDKANEYFSKLEGDVFHNSFLKIPRIILGPGKRGSLSPKKATTSEVIVMKVNDRERLGYMQGSDGHLIGQIIMNGNKFSYESEDIADVEEELKNIVEQIKHMENKYVHIKLDNKTSEIIIAYFKRKIHIASYEYLANEEILKIKEAIVKNIFSIGKHIKSDKVKLEGKILIKEDEINIKKVVAKTAINTLAYLEGEEYVNLPHLTTIKQMIMDPNNISIDNVAIECHNAKKIKEDCRFRENQHACIIRRDYDMLYALVFIYDRCWQIQLTDTVDKELKYPLIGYICDWENKKEYSLFEYYKKIGVLTNYMYI